MAWYEFLFRSRVPGFPGSQVPRFPGSQVPRFPGSQVLVSFFFYLSCLHVKLFTCILQAKKTDVGASVSQVYFKCFWYYYQISVRSSFRCPFRRSLVLASQTTNIILVHLKQFCFHSLKDNKTSVTFPCSSKKWPFSVCTNFTVLPKSSMTCFITNTFFFLSFWFSD